MYTRHASDERTVGRQCSVQSDVGIGGCAVAADASASVSTIRIHQKRESAQTREWRKQKKVFFDVYLLGRRGSLLNIGLNLMRTTCVSCCVVCPASGVSDSVEILVVVFTCGST